MKDGRAGREQSNYSMSYDNVEIATREDLKVAIANALSHADCSFDELAEQSRTGEYKSMRARLAWAAIGDLYQVEL